MKFLDPRAIKDWIKSRAVNSMMATEKGFFMDARQGPVIREELDDIQTGLDEINSNLPIQTKAIITGKNEYYVSSSTCVKLSNNYIISFTIGTQATYTQNTLKNIGSSTVKPPYLKYGIALVMSGNVVLGIASIYLDQNGELFLNANFTANFLVINCFLMI